MGVKTSVNVEIAQFSAPCAWMAYGVAARTTKRTGRFAAGGDLHKSEL